jgi:quinol monooxygenase YgiN
MFGTIARAHVRPGKEAELLALSRSYPQLEIPGLLGQYLFMTDRASGEFYLVVIFENKELYMANADAPEQHQRFLQMRELLADDPEWHDGEIVWAQTAALKM